jgi:HAD superfamily hydrolase (TIGR01509 family)
MTQFKAALFDLDGTLVDTEAQYSVFWKKMGEIYHPEIPDFDQIIKGTTLDNIYQNYFPDPLIQNKISPVLQDWEIKMNYPFINGAESFIRELKNNDVLCAVVTSSNNNKINALRKKICYFDDMFDLILTSEMFHESKPDPDCYLLAAKLLNCKIEECVVFEDAINGLNAGMNANMFTVGLSTTNSAEVIKKICNHVVEDFTSLNYNLLNELLYQHFLLNYS